MSDHIDPDAETVVLGTFDSLETQGFGRFSMARYVVRDLTRADLLVTPEHDAAVAAKAVREALRPLRDYARQKGNLSAQVASVETSEFLRALANDLNRLMDAIERGAKH